MPETAAHTQACPVAVVGVGALFPGAVDAGSFWRNILAGTDLLTDVPESHWLIDDYYDPDPTAVDKVYGKRGGFLPDVDFNPVEFGIPPSIVPATDTAQLLALIVAKQVLDDAAQGDFAKTTNRERISVVLGVTSATELIMHMAGRMQRPVLTKSLREHGLAEADVQAVCDRVVTHYQPWQESTFPGLLGNVVAGRIANRFDLGGMNCVTDAACASSLSALSIALSELYLGHSDMVIAGGVDAMNDISMFLCFSKTPALSPSGDCRPFDASSDGTILGEGLGMVALKRLSDAERDGDQIYAVIRGLGAASDGRALSVYAPLPAGQAKAMRRTYEMAGYGPETVELVEAHGTGTKAGDAAEFTSTSTVFGENDRKDRQWCALGSVKSQIGHTKAAAGAAGLIKVVLALHHKILPPTIKIDEPNPKLDITNSAFYLNTQSRPWIRDASHPRRAALSSFGFGGTNFHVTVEEYAGTGLQAPHIRTTPTELVLLSAADSPALLAQCRTMAETLTPQTTLQRIAHDSQAQFANTQPARLAVVATDLEDLRTKLAQAAERIAQQPEEGFSLPFGVSYGVGPIDGKVAFLFSGQGSQYVGMGADLAMAFAPSRLVWDLAATLPFHAETQLHRVVFPIPAFTDADRAAQTKQLTATEWAQPAIGTTSLAQLQILRALGIAPACVGGHSFGEVTALYAAGALRVEDFLKVARQRGELMAAAAAVIPGAMTAVARPVEEVRAWLAAWQLDVVIANHNSPTQVVLSGSTEAIAQAEARLAEAGATAKRLPVATAFHSPLVSGSSEPFFGFLQDVTVSQPTIPVFSNAAAAPYQEDPAIIRRTLADQLGSPVRFVEMIEAMYASGVRTFIEVGPGGVLTDLVERCLKGRPFQAVNLDRKGQHGVTSLWHGLGKLAATGIAMDLAPLWLGYALPQDGADAKPAFALAINGSNYGKPYPAKDGSNRIPPPNPPVTAQTAPAVTAQSAVAPAITAPLAAAPAVSAQAPSPPVIAAPSQMAAPAASYAPRPNGTGAVSADTQRLAADAHATFQQALSDSHQAFMQTFQVSVVQSHQAFIQAMEASFLNVCQALGGQAPAVNGTPQAVSQPALATIPQPAPTPNVPTAPVLSSPAVAPVIHSPAADMPAPNPAVALAIQTPAVAPMADLQTVLMAIVADKTGYPISMLSADMALEADLGIDSIKRVEILSAMQEQVPDLPKVDLAIMGTLRSLGEIAAYLGDSLPATNGHSAAEANGQPAAGAIDQPATVANGQPSADHGSVDLEALLLAIVADKTGYPVTMLTADMALEADLGIDSIKRVEILSAMQEQVPSLPKVDLAVMGTLRSLGEIAHHLQGASTTVAASVPVARSQDQAALITTVSRQIVKAVAAPATGHDMLHGLIGTVAVTNDGTGVAEALVYRLRKHGLTANVVDTVPADAAVVVFLGGLSDLPDVDAALTVNREAFHAAKAVGERFERSGGVFVLVQDTGGDFALSGCAEKRAWLGGLAGLAKTAAQEWPTARVKAIDLARGDRSPMALAEALFDELQAGGTEVEVGLRTDGTRLTVTTAPATVTPGANPVTAQSVIVASGGARGVTATALIALAKQAQPRFVLLGRSALDDEQDEPAACRLVLGDAALKGALLAAATAAGRAVTPAELSRDVNRIQASRDIRATLAALSAAGSPATYVAVDVQDAAALAAALAPIRADWGPITGIVHGAGVLADKPITAKSADQFDRVFNTKVLGLQALLAATADDPVEVICLFSSVAGRFGNVGQSDYAMANEILNKVAGSLAARPGSQCRVKALNWGPWAGGMVTPALQAHFQSRGVALIPIEIGADMFVAELTDTSPGAVEVVIGSPLVEAGTRDMAIMVNHDTYPFLVDHSIQSVPVVPAMLAMEWFARAAKALRPDLHILAIRDLKVLKGIPVDTFDRAGLPLSVSLQDTRDGETTDLHLILLGAQGQRHYMATVEMGRNAGAALVAPFQRDDLALGAIPWPESETYDSILFHGPDFQVIRSLDGVSDTGISGVLAGAVDHDWPDGPWQLDVALLDGALQLAGLWGYHMQGRASLPTRVGRCRMRSVGLLQGPIQCLLRTRAIGEHRTVSHVVFLVNGQVIGDMEDVECHLLPAAVTPVMTEVV